MKFQKGAIVDVYEERKPAYRGCILEPENSAGQAYVCNWFLMLPFMLFIFVVFVIFAIVFDCVFAIVKAIDLISDSNQRPCSGGVLQTEQCATLEPSDVVTACYVQF